MRFERYKKIGEQSLQTLQNVFGPIYEKLTNNSQVDALTENIVRERSVKYHRQSQNSFQLCRFLLYQNKLHKLEDALVDQML